MVFIGSLFKFKLFLKITILIDESNALVFA